MHARGDIYNVTHLPRADTTSGTAGIVRLPGARPTDRSLIVPMPRSSCARTDLDRPVRQTAFVVDDIQAPARGWADVHDLGPCFLYDVDIPGTGYGVLADVVRVDASAPRRERW